MCVWAPAVARAIVGAGTPQDRDRRALLSWGFHLGGSFHLGQAKPINKETKILFKKHGLRAYWEGLMQAAVVGTGGA